MKALESNISKFRVLLFFCESVLILATLCLSNFFFFLYKHGLAAYPFFDWQHSLATGMVFVALCQACMYLNELYDYNAWRDLFDLAIRLLQALGIACILMSPVCAVFKSLCTGHALFIALPFVLLALFFWRILSRSILLSRNLRERIVILGSSKLARTIVEEIEDTPHSGFEVAAIVSDDGRALEGLSCNPAGAPAVIPLEEFPQRVDSLRANRIVLTLAERRGKLPFRALVDCRFKGIFVEDATSFYETLKGKIYLEDVRPSYFIFAVGFRKSKFTLRVKRITDLILASGLLVLSAPLMILTAILIRLDSPGPVIYRQDRVGEGWKDFTLYKFRSMIQNAEATGAVWAEKEDPRITRVGRFIRKRRIDELPQLFNVLKGDMSFVGPRPERRVFMTALAQEIPYYPQRLFVKPGVTGWAQINYHYGASRDETIEKLQYDLYYIKHMSLFFDLSIIFDTIRVVFSGAGSR